VGDEGTLIWSFPAPAMPSTPSAARIEETLRTLPGGLMGTLRYMSPEQARGETATAASDMYALGLVLQELFTGQPAYEASLTAPEALERTRKGQSLPVRGLGRDLTGLIESLKSSTPSRRPTALETLRRLQWIQRRPQRLLRRGLVAGVLLAGAAGATKYTLDLATERARAQGRTEAALGMMETLFTEQVPVLHEVGRLDAFDAAAEGVEAYFTRIADEQPTDTEQVQLARLLNLVGDVREMQGRGEEALARFEEARVLADELAARHPDDPEVLLVLGAAEFYIGRNDLQRDDAGAALERFQAYLDAAQRSAAHDPDRLRAVREVSYARTAVAGALLDLGRADEALAEQEQVVALWRDLCAERPGDEVVRLDLADNLSWLASAQRQAGHDEAAHDSFEEELELRRDMVAEDPRNAEARARLSYCLGFLADIHLATGRLDDAVDSALEARDLLAGLCELDPENADLAVSLEDAEQTLARAEVAAGR
jgi:tetratricopeptide (TPR) repeat protein